MVKEKQENQKENLFGFQITNNYAIMIVQRRKTIGMK